MKKSLLDIIEACPEKLKSLFETVEYAPQDLMITQGDEAEYVFVLLEGEAKVYHMTMNGISVLEYIYSNGELFGEIEVLNNKPNISNIVTKTKCKVVRVRKDVFLKWIELDSDLSLYVNQQMADKLYEACLNSATNIAYPLKYRVLFYLWNLSKKNIVYINKEDIIAGVGSNTRSINRIIRELIDENLIDYYKGVVKVKSVKQVINEMSRYC